MSPAHITPTPSELPGLRAAMRHVQEAIREYYDASIGFVDADALAARAKNAVAAVQVLNDQLTNQFSNQGDYSRLLEAPGRPAETVLGFKYLRNVVQHIIHLVEPSPDSAVGGVGLGFRTFSTWADVPDSVHKQLHGSTRELRPHFERRLLGEPVVQTLMDAAAFFASVSPELVDRDEGGEWTAFPLRHQAGVLDRLHPEEPTEVSAAVSWMNGRKPGGDGRVICGSLTDTHAEFLFGVTFRRHCIMTPFFETPDQVDADLTLGYPYYEAPVELHTTEVRLNDRYDLFERVLCSDSELDNWAGEPLASASDTTGDCTFEQTDWWADLLQLEMPRNSQWYLTRRERRLCAWYPIA